MAERYWDRPLSRTLRLKDRNKTKLTTLREASEALIEAFEDTWHWTSVPRPLSMKKAEDVPDPISIYSKSSGAYTVKVSSRRSGTRRGNAAI
jgi:hypothetical protein